LEKRQFRSLESFHYSLLPFGALASRKTLHCGLWQVPFLEKKNWTGDYKMNEATQKHGGIYGVYDIFF
jgi:hypothetical protein